MPEPDAPGVLSVASRKDRPRPSGPPLPPNWRPNFFEYLEAHGTLWKAARHAGVSHRTVLRTRERDPEFDAAVDEALQYHADSLEEELQQSAVKSDNPVGWIVRLKAIRPQRYIEKHAIMTVTVNAEIAGPDAAALLASMLQCATPATAPLLAGATAPLALNAPEPTTP